MARRSAPGRTESRSKPGQSVRPARRPPLPPLLLRAHAPPHRDRLDVGVVPAALCRVGGRQHQRMGNQDRFAGTDQGRLLLQAPQAAVPTGIEPALLVPNSGEIGRRPRVAPVHPPADAIPPIEQLTRPVVVPAGDPVQTVRRRPLKARPVFGHEAGEHIVPDPGAGCVVQATRRAGQRDAARRDVRRAGQQQEVLQRTRFEGAVGAPAATRSTGSPSAPSAGRPRGCPHPGRPRRNRHRRPRADRRRPVPAGAGPPTPAQEGRRTERRRPGQRSWSRAAVPRRDSSTAQEVRGHSAWPVVLVPSTRGRDR